MKPQRRLSSSTFHLTGCVLLHNKTYYTETKRLLQAFLVKLVPDVGIELTTYRLQGGCSTTELIRHIGGGKRDRTDDL